MCFDISNGVISNGVNEEMQKHEYARLARLESFYFWNIGRREILKEVLLRHIGKRNDLEILDVGCGSGGNINLLAEFGRVTGLDVSPEALRFAKNYDFTNLVQADAKAIPFPDRYFSLVTSLDVFEHIEDDKKALQESFRVLKNGGFILLTVPAHLWLWSDHDKVMLHKRRYARSEILRRVKETGFKILECSNFVFPGVPVHFLRKTRESILRKFIPQKSRTVDTYVREFSKGTNNFLLSLLRFEKFLIRFVSLPLGTSVFVIAKKP